MSKNILVTGLILGKETEMCQCSDINVGWLFERPSDLLWADKIIVTQNEWQVIKNDNSSAISKASRLIFEKLQAEGLVQLIPDTIITPSRAEDILHNIKMDLQYIDDLYTESENDNDPVMTMGKSHFCIPSLWTLYAAIELSWELNASFSLTPDELVYLTTLIPRKYEKEIHAGRNMAIEEVLSLYLPSVELGHVFLVDSARGRCNECARFAECSGTYLTKIEKQVDMILKLRQYDEIRMTCEVMDKICERSILQGHVLSGNELWDDLQEEASKTERMMKSKLRRMKLWSRISTFATIGLGAASFLHPVIGIGAAVPALAEQMLKSYGEKMKKETSWVNFVNNPEAVLGKN